MIHSYMPKVGEYMYFQIPEWPMKCACMHRYHSCQVQVLYIIQFGTPDIQTNKQIDAID